MDKLEFEKIVNAIKKAEYEYEFFHGKYCFWTKDKNKILKSDHEKYYKRLTKEELIEYYHKKYE